VQRFAAENATKLKKRDFADFPRIAQPAGASPAGFLPPERLSCAAGMFAPWRGRLPSPI
jgi:hypothetical protein